MITAIQISGKVNLGTFDIYTGQHLIGTHDSQVGGNYPIPVRNNGDEVIGIRNSPRHPLPDPHPMFGTAIEAVTAETTYGWVYTLVDGTNHASTAPHDLYYGSLFLTTDSKDFNPNDELILVGESIYQFRRISITPTRATYFQSGTVSSSRNLPRPPNYIDLLSGYYLDTRVVPQSPQIIPTANETIVIGYYRENKLDNIIPVRSMNGLRSIDWMRYKCYLIKGRPYKLPIVDCVLGTLYSSSEQVKTQIKGLPTLAGNYDYADYFDSRLGSLFTTWNSLYQADLSAVLEPPQHPFTGGIETKYVYQVEGNNRVLRTLGANNNHWHNRPIETPDFNFDINHPMFKVEDERTYNWHFKPDSEGYDIGDLVMDSTRTVEIHAALNAGKFARNELDSEKPREANLGNYIERLAQINGYRINAHGEVNIDDEKKNKARRLIKDKESINQKEYGGNGFGSEGMLVRRLPNYFNRKDIKDGGVVAIHDHAQLMLEILDQINLAVGIQDSGAIEIKHGDNTHRYPNLLGLLTEIAIHQFNQSDYAKQTHISSLVTQEQTKEIIGGLGLPTVAKNIARTVNGKNAGIPYWGIAPQASLAKRIDTCTYNVGIVLGQLL